MFLESSVLCLVFSWCVLVVSFLCWLVWFSSRLPAGPGFRCGVVAGAVGEVVVGVVGLLARGKALLAALLRA